MVDLCGIFVVNATEIHIRMDGPCRKAKPSSLLKSQPLSFGVGLPSVGMDKFYDLPKSSTVWLFGVNPMIDQSHGITAGVFLLLIDLFDSPYPGENLMI